MTLCSLVTVGVRSSRAFDQVTLSSIRLWIYEFALFRQTFRLLLRLLLIWLTEVSYAVSALTVAAIHFVEVEAVGFAVLLELFDFRLFQGGLVQADILLLHRIVMILCWMALLLCLYPWLGLVRMLWLLLLLWLIIDNVRARCQIVINGRAVEELLAELLLLLNWCHRGVLLGHWARINRRLSQCRVVWLRDAWRSPALHMLLIGVPHFILSIYVPLEILKIWISFIAIVPCLIIWVY